MNEITIVEFLNLCLTYTHDFVVSALVYISQIRMGVIINTFNLMIGSLFMLSYRRAMFWWFFGAFVISIGLLNLFVLYFASH